MVFDFFFKPKKVSLPFETDMHCHLVPGVDDGSPDVETSILLLEQMVDMGFKRIFISPHVTQDTFENTSETLDGPMAQLQAEAQRRGLPVELYRHAEYRIDDFFLQQKKNDKLTVLPNNYILVENPFSQEPYELDNMLFDIKMSGLTPIMAHPERYKYYSIINPDRYSQLHDFGILFQINMLSLAGRYGRHERNTALELLENGMVEFIGTDIHSQSHTKLLKEYLSSRAFRRDIRLMTNLRNDEI